MNVAVIAVGIVVFGFGQHPLFEIVLVSPENQVPESVKDLVAVHIPWQGPSTRRRARALAQALKEAEVALAHFQFGGNYGWGSRIPGRSPIPYVRKVGIPVVTTIHVFNGILEGYCDSAKPRWLKLAYLPLTWLGKADVLRNTSAEIVISQEAFREMQGCYPLWKDRFVAIYHSRIQPSHHSSVPMEARRKEILCVGHLAVRKGQHIVTEAFGKIAHRHPDWKLRIVGDAVEPQMIQNITDLCRQADILDRVSLDGPRNSKDAFELMNKSAIFVQPSFFEGLPLALQEAMFAGCAVIGTRIRGNRELITDGKTGLAVEPGDVEGLAAALERLITDEELRKRFGSAANTFIMEAGMNAPTMIEQHRAIYRKLLHSETLIRADSV